MAAVTTLTVRKAILLALLWLSHYSGTALAQQEIVTVPTRAGVTQSYFLTSIPKDLKAVAVLFPGSGGLIRLRNENGKIRFAQKTFSCVVVRSLSNAVRLRRSSTRRPINRATGE
jgi:hypothetical protein